MNCIKKYILIITFILISFNGIAFSDTSTIKLVVHGRFRNFEKYILCLSTSKCKQMGGKRGEYIYEYNIKSSKMYSEDSTHSLKALRYGRQRFKGSFSLNPVFIQINDSIIAENNPESKYSINISDTSSEIQFQQQKSVQIEALKLKLLLESFSFSNIDTSKIIWIEKVDLNKHQSYFLINWINESDYQNRIQSHKNATFLQDKNKL